MFTDVFRRAARLWRAAGDRVFERYDRADGFDRRYGTDTTAVVHVTERAERTGTVPEPYRYAHRYCPVHVRALAHALASVAPVAKGRAFVDLGSGKGRVVLEATRLPFAEIVGVELDAELHQISTENLERASSRLNEPGRVRLVRGDARQLVWPVRELVVFAFCPFALEIMSAVVASLDASLDASPRACTFLYLGSEGPDVALDRSRHLRVVERSRVRGISRFVTDAGRRVRYERDVRRS